MVKGTRSFHCVQPDMSGGAVTVKVRRLTCLCDFCRIGTGEGCENAEYVGQAAVKCLLAAGGVQDGGSDEGGASTDDDLDAFPGEDGGVEIGGRFDGERLVQLIKPVSRGHGKPHMLDLACNVVVAPVQGQVYPADGECDYHIMRVTEGPYTLLSEKEDGWGNKFPAGAVVVEGYFFRLARNRDGSVMQQYKGLYTYNNNNLAIVGTSAVVMVGFKMGHEQARYGRYHLDSARHELAVEVVGRLFGEEGGFAVGADTGLDSDDESLDGSECSECEESGMDDGDDAEEYSLWDGSD